jgi:hypothetical protein
MGESTASHCRSTSAGVIHTTEAPAASTDSTKAR